LLIAHCHCPILARARAKASSHWPDGAGSEEEGLLLCSVVVVGCGT